MFPRPSPKTSLISINFDPSRFMEAVEIIHAAQQRHPALAVEVRRFLDAGEQPVVINPNWMGSSEGGITYLLEPAPWLAHIASVARALAASETTSQIVTPPDVSAEPRAPVK